jgi:Ca2+-binding EF-hand superfamily protein
VRIFQLFDSDKSGQVDFHECALCLWTFCTLEEDELVMFAYELYDMDGSGSMDKAEVQQILEDVYGKQFATNPMAKA